MSIALSDRQKDDLHKAMLDYLFSAGFQKGYSGLKEDLPSLAGHQSPSDAQTTGILVKKWTSIIRMQKKILDLETKLQQALEDNASMPSGSSRKYKEDWVPSANAKHVLTGHRSRVTSLCFHPRYSVIVTGSEDATLKVWDWETGELERTLKAHTKHVTDCSFDGKGHSLVSSSQDYFIKLWNVDEEYQNFATLRGHEHDVTAAKFLPNDTHIISSSWDQTVRIWEIASTHCVKVFRPHDDWIFGVIPSSDGRYALTCSKDHSARLIDIESGVVKSDLRGHDNIVEVVAFAPPNTLEHIKQLVSFTPPTGSDATTVTFVATGSRDKLIKLWDALRGVCVWTFHGHDDWIHGLVFHPSGKYLLSTGDDKCIRVWELQTGRCMRKIEAHEQFVGCMAWSRQPIAGSGAADGAAVKENGKVDVKSKAKDDDVVRPVNVLATGSFDKTVKIWMP